MSRIAVFGDVHGHLPVLNALYQRVNDLYKIDQWYSAGDLCDRGPDTPGVIQFCIDNSIQTVLGNHDEWLLYAIKGGLDRDIGFKSTWTYPSNGGQETIRQYGGTFIKTGDWYNSHHVIIGFKPPAHHEEWLAGLPTVIETEHGYVLHGGISPKNVRQAANKIKQELLKSGHQITMDEAKKLVTPFDCNEHSIRWHYEGRQTAEKACHYWEFDKPQIVGHNGVEKPVISRSHIAIDTGCAWTRGGGLTAVILPEREFVTVAKEEIYGAFPPE